ncbi:hypothetical protein RhiirA4_477235 [Rhizophagus irregularis]|uniref:Uncharacterized protein n=1 Tax=Rhizophagus irregularis TaxID=588596 RepID=A0A2I1HCX2_9GLOM|nr:hypothetical protein RhiirA4_477235 [Rhizophagus irregularis]
MVDCGGGTEDLTTRRLLQDSKLSEITEQTGDSCGGSYVNREFLSRKLSESTINLLRKNNYDRNDFDSFEFNIEEICPVLKQYCKDEIKEKMEDNCAHLYTVYNTDIFK